MSRADRMDMFTKDEAFLFIKNFLRIENAEQRMQEDRRKLLDEILYNIITRVPFQSVWLLSKPPSERRKPTLDEVKSCFLSGIGGLCFEMNMCTFFLLSAIGFDVDLLHATVSSTVRFYHNHLSLMVKNVQKEGDKFLADVAAGTFAFQAIDLDFDKESQVYVNSYLEYKYVKHNGKILRMHRKGDMLAMRGPQENSDIEFWMDDWRRFFEVEMEGSKDMKEFEPYHESVHTNPKWSPFHHSLRVVTFGGGKASIVADEKTLIENDKGELVSTPLSGGDKGIISAVQKISPNIPEELLRKALKNWRETRAS